MAGNMKFSHAVGYRGLCSIQPNGDNDATVLLCTGGNINLTQDPIMSGGVWGAGYANAAPIAYAFNYLSLEGSVNFEWVNQSAVWEALKKFAFTNRTAQTLVNLLPDGANGFHGYGWCSSLSFEASEGAALTGSMNFKGDPSNEEDNEDFTGSSGGAETFGIISNDDVLELGFTNGTSTTEKLGIGDEGTYPYLGTANTNDPLMFGTGSNGRNLVGAVLIPYWNTKVSTMNTEGGYEMVDDVISWNCSYNSDLQVLKCCSYGKHLHKDTHTPIGADYILCGEMSGEGSLTIFALRQSGACSFAPEGFHTRKRNLTFTLGGFDANPPSDHGVPKSVVIPNALINSASTAMATGASYITTDYSFTAIGDGVNSVLHMTDDDPTAGSSSSSTTEP